jgi:ATP-dependent DNA helicase Rep
MRERVGKLLPGQAGPTASVSTFHSLGVRILREEAKALGYKPRFSILDATDTAAASSSEVSQEPDKAQPAPCSGAHLQLEECAGHARARGKPPRTRAQRQAHRLPVLRGNPARLPGGGFRRPDPPAGPAVPGASGRPGNAGRAACATCWSTNTRTPTPASTELLKLLTGPAPRFTAVGDDDQAIYAWRGADVENLRRLKPKTFRAEGHQAGAELPFDASASCAAANSVIANNEKLFDKKLWSNWAWATIQVTGGPRQRAEAETVVMKLQAHRFEHRGKFKDYAILYRGNHQARLFEEAAAQPEDSLPALRRPVLLRQGRNQGPRRLSAPARQPGRRPRLHPRRHHAAPRHRRRHPGGLGDHAGERHVAVRTPPSNPASRRTGARPATRTAAGVLRLHQPHALARRAEPARQVLEDLLAAIDYEEWLYDRTTAPPRPNGRTCATSSTGWRRRARKTRQDPDRADQTIA